MIEGIKKIKIMFNPVRERDLLRHLQEHSLFGPIPGIEDILEYLGMGYDRVDGVLTVDHCEHADEKTSAFLGEIAMFVLEGSHVDYADGTTEMLSLVMS